MSQLTKSLLRENLITNEQLDLARNEQLTSKKSIQEILVKKGFIREEDLINISSKVFNIPTLNIAETKIDPSLLKIVPEKIARQYNIFPLYKVENAIILAIGCPIDIIALDDVRIILGAQIKPVLSVKDDIKKCIDKYYRPLDSIEDLLAEAVNNAENAKFEMLRRDEWQQSIVDEDTKEHAHKTSIIIRLINYILSEAIKMKASDIHIEPQENNVIVRYRLDGSLKYITKIHSIFHPSLAARIKILTDMDIAETRKPQEGRATVSVYGKKIDLRVSTMPTFFGEKFAIRLLDPNKATIDFDKLGLQRDQLNIFLNAIKKPQGIILVTGPTGSGKTTTLYTALNFVKNETKNIVTIEDPIEYIIGDINQMQVSPAKNITFASALRNLLRQDPNVILVGEIRDRETAEVAFRASLTGHQVFSAVHTNNAISTIIRLLDIGLEPYLIASSLTLIIAQRLVKLICANCKEEYMPDKEVLNRFKLYIERYNIKKFYKGKGCEHCSFTGYSGRVGIYEMLQIDDTIRSLIARKSGENIIFKEARKKGLKLLAEAGIQKVASELTTLEEVETAVCTIEEEKRKHSRFHVSCPITYINGNSNLRNSSVMLNVSKKGALISTNEFIEITKNLTVHVASKDKRFIFDSKVVHIESLNGGGPPYNVGLEFHEKTNDKLDDFYKEMEKQNTYIYEKK